MNSLLRIECGLSFELAIMLATMIRQARIDIIFLINISVSGIEDKRETK
jgi:hypothetical protein